MLLIIGIKGTRYLVAAQEIAIPIFLKIPHNPNNALGFMMNIPIMMPTIMPSISISWERTKGEKEWEGKETENYV